MKKFMPYLITAGIALIAVAIVTRIAPLRAIVGLK
jgi:hypothetical protein